MENEKEEKEEKGEIEMGKREFVKEHRHLNKVLTKGTRSEQKSEARKQKRELKREAGR